MAHIDYYLLLFMFVFEQFYVYTYSHIFIIKYYKMNFTVIFITIIINK